MKRVIFYSIVLVIIGVILFIKKQKGDEAKVWNRAVTYSSSEQYKDAIPHLKKLVSKNPKNQKYMAALAECYHHENLWDDAIFTDERLLRLDPNNDAAKKRIEQNKHSIEMEKYTKTHNEGGEKKKPEDEKNKTKEKKE